MVVVEVVELALRAEEEAVEEEDEEEDDVMGFSMAECGDFEGEEGAGECCSCCCCC